jgi:hypothetical protein
VKVIAFIASNLVTLSNGNALNYFGCKYRGQIPKLGLLPLIMASGAGAESLIAIGWVILGPWDYSCSDVLLTTVLCDMLAGFSKPSSTVKKTLEEELAKNPALQYF